MKMSVTLEEFSERIPSFDELTSAEKIEYFVYWLINEQGMDGAAPSEINACFTNLSCEPYSNVCVYLQRHANGKGRKFIKKGRKYCLERKRKNEIMSSLGIPKIVITGDLFSLELFNDTRDYLLSTAKQASACYEYGLHDACLVMIRKLVETLIIDLFEKRSISDRIKDADGNFLYLSGLIPKLLSCNEWSLSRNVKAALPKIKKKGDMSAHSRHYTAKKKDIDEIRDDLRVVIEELLHLISY
jgi:hypothetical protein